MGWFSGNYRSVNDRTFGRMAEAKGLMAGIKDLGVDFGKTAHNILSELTTAQMSEASKAREGSIAAADTRNLQALEKGLASSADPLQQAAVAGAYGADRSVAEAVRMHGKMKSGILEEETRQHINVEKVEAASKVASNLGQVGVLESVDERVSEGYGTEVMSILGMVAGANMDKIMGMFKSKVPDPYEVEMPTDPAIEHEQQMKAGLDHVKPTEVRGVDIPMSENVTGPKPAAPEVQPTSLLENLGTKSMGKTGSIQSILEKAKLKRALRLSGRAAPKGLMGIY